MILYKVRAGIVTAISVKKETKCGWRLHNNGFINRKVMSKRFVHLDEEYCTSDINEAKIWQKLARERMHELIQVSKASECDIEVWCDNGMNEDSTPKSRFSVSKE